MRPHSAEAKAAVTAEKKQLKATILGMLQQHQRRKGPLL